MSNISEFSYIAGEWGNGTGQSYDVHNPDTGDTLHVVHNNTADDVDKAVKAAQAAYLELRQKSADDIAGFLDTLADEIMDLGDNLLELANSETALGLPRFTGERGRTCGQLKAFASIVRDQSWLQPCIDTALPDREPLPKPDVRRCFRPLGPVAVFSASNFPMAFATLGGDSASALAAGNPIIVKGHPSHSATSVLFARAAEAAIKKCGFPIGTFSLLQGSDPELTCALVEHSGIEAVGFTGSLKVGRIIYDLAAKRPRPIPVFAELGSINPLFITPESMSSRGDAIAAGLAGSMTLGTGQFCTQPGLIVACAGSDTDTFISTLSTALDDAPVGVLLNGMISSSLDKQVTVLKNNNAVSCVTGGERAEGANRFQNTLLTTTASNFLSNSDFAEEVFGPVSLLVLCENEDDMIRVAEAQQGNLTGSIHCSDGDDELVDKLVNILEDRVGRIVFNGFPTGVEVCPSMHHGGPYPASTAVATTSVGAAAITRFARVVSYQATPQAQLPEVLKDKNPGGVMRLVNGEYTTNDVSS